MKRFNVWSWVALSCLTCGGATAGEGVITARIDNNQYVNTTPQADYCRQWGLAQYCSSRWTVDIPFSFSKDVDLSSADNRDKVYVRVPAPQSLTLINQSTNATAPMQVRFDKISQRVFSPAPVVSVDPGGSCNSSYGTIGSPGAVRFLWSMTNSTTPRACYSTTRPTTGDTHSVTISDLGLGLVPEFPAPASLAPGLWVGVIDYPIGPGQGFDFGNIQDASSNSIRLRFEVRVQHDIRVDFPAAGTEVALQPPGGWQNYLNTDEVPERLYHNAPLRVWAGGSFMVYATCLYGSSTYCSLRHPSINHSVPMRTALTLPGTFTYNGQPVERMPIGIGVANAKQISPSGNVSNQPGMVHFDIAQANLTEMFRYRGVKYSSDVTLVFDANL